MKNVSASKLHRVAICPASAVLPQSPSREEQAVRGTVIHEFLERASTAGRDSALDGVPEQHRAICELIDLEQWPVDPKCYTAEVAFAYNFANDTAREIGRGLGRKYPPLKYTEIAGTADIVGLSNDSVLIADVKTGHQPYVAPARFNKQLRLLALSACRAYGRNTATVELLHLRYDGTPWRDRAELNAFDLEEFALELQDIAARVERAQADVAEGSTPLLVTGSHCRYCDAFTSCSAQTALVRAMASAPDRLDAEIRSALTPQTAGLAYERLKVAEMCLDRVRKAIYAYAERQKIQLPNGMVLGPVETAKESLIGPIARDVLTKMLGQPIADAACEFETSKAAIRRAIKPCAESLGQPIARLEKAALEEIRKAGGVVVKQSISVREHRAKDEEAA